MPTASASKEKELVAGIISTLKERKYDRALHLLLQGKIQEVVGLSSEEASFGGNLMKTMSDIAQNDVVFVNTAEDEESRPSSPQERTGLS